MRGKGIDYFENSRRATYVQQQYAIDNPLKFEATAAVAGASLRATDPGPTRIKVDGIERQFFGYLARGVPYGPDDGTLAPWAVAGVVAVRARNRAARARLLHITRRN